MTCLVPRITEQLLLERVRPVLTELLHKSNGSDGDLRVVEAALGVAVAAVRSAMVNAALDAAASKCAAYYCPACRQPLTRWAQKARAVVTSQGKGTMEIGRFRCVDCRKDHYPLQTLNALEKTHFTIGARELIAAEAAETPFARAAVRLDRLGIPVSASEVDRIVKETGAWRKEEEEAVRGHLFLTGRDLNLSLHDLKAWKEADAKVAAVLSVDGGMVRSDTQGERGCEWFEVRSAVLTLAAKSAPKITIGGLMTPDLLFETLRSQSRQVLDAGRPIVFVADGAKWIWERVRLHFPKAIEVLDIYHGGEHAASAAKACWGVDSPVAKKWIVDARGQLQLPDGARIFRTMLSDALAGGVALDAQTVITELGYLTAHAHRMDYASLNDKGLPIGSGVIESAVKQITCQRLRQPGMMWTKSGADLVMRLRAAHISGSFGLTIDRQYRICDNRMKVYKKAA